jgi:hypothetical protein
LEWDNPFGVNVEASDINKRWELSPLKAVALQVPPIIGDGHYFEEKYER